MNRKAQAGLEYLMTYGWALILVATIITVLVFVVGGEKPGVVFTVSDPTKFLLKSTGVSGNTAGIVLGNATGGRIMIKSIAFSGDLSYTADSKLNGQIPSLPIDLIAGGEIRLEGLNASNGGANGGVTIQYKDYANFDREVNIRSSGSAATGTVASFSLEGETADKGWNGSAVKYTGPTTESGCPSGKCLQFAVGNSIGLPTALKDISNFDGNASTITAWVKVSNPNKNNFITVNVAGSYYFSAGTADVGAKLKSMVRRCDNTANWWPRSTGTIAANQWTHVAYVFEGGKGYKFAINGAVEDHPDTIGCFKFWGDAPLLSSNTAAWAFVGYLDEVRVYNRALSGSEICNECKASAANVAAIQPGFACNC